MHHETECILSVAPKEDVADVIRRVFNAVWIMHEHINGHSRIWREQQIRRRPKRDEDEPDFLPNGTLGCVLRTMEDGMSRQDTDDLKRDSIDDKGLANRIDIASEQAFTQQGSDDSHLIAPFVVLIRQEDPSFKGVLLVHEPGQ